MPRAPISGVVVTFVAANGHDDLLLHESAAGARVGRRRSSSGAPVPSTRAHCPWATSTR